jgi:hypothetical protein
MTETTTNGYAAEAAGPVPPRRRILTGELDGTVVPRPAAGPRPSPPREVVIDAQPST